MTMICFRRFAAISTFTAALLCAPLLHAQTAAAKPAADTDRSSAYYHYGLSHLYEEMAVNQGRPDYATQAIEEYKLALNADPDNSYLQTGLADTYFRLGRIRDAVVAAQDQIKKDPNNLDAHLLLGRIYLRSLGDMQSAPSGQMLQLAIAEYAKIVTLQPANTEHHLLLGQLYALNHESEKAEAQFKAAQQIDPNAEETALNLARLYSDQGDYLRAIETLTAVPVSDRSTRINFALGGLYDQLHQTKKAIEAYRAVLDEESDNLDAQRGLALALLTDGQFDASLKQFQEIVAAEPADGQSWIHIAEIQRHKGQFEEALTTLEKAKALVPDSLELTYNQALIYDALGRYDEAIQTLTTIIAGSIHTDGKYSDGEKSNRYLFLDRLANIYREQNRTTDAIDAYRKMIELGGDFARSGYQGEVDAYRDARMNAQATATAADAVKAIPDDTGLKLMYAGQLADAGKPDDGIALAKSLINGKNDRDVQIALAQIYLRLQRFPDAEAAINSADALSQKPEDKEFVTFLRGTIADKQKQYDAAEVQFRKVLANDPNNAQALNYLGYMFADRGVKLDEALVLIRKAVDAEPQNGAYLDSLGWVYFKLGQYTLAEENLRKAVERLSTDPTVHDHLGELYEKTGKLKLAVAQWERSLNEAARSLPADVDPADTARVQKKLEGAKVKLAKEGPAAAAKP